jgi:integrase
VAKRISNRDLGSRTARQKLKPSGKPYYCSISEKLHLGYRKGKGGGGKWVIRRYLGDERYIVETLQGVADDFADSDGERVLSFDQAQDKARERLKALVEEERIAAHGPTITVRDAISEYVGAREAKDHGQIGFKRDARSRLTKHVLADEKLASTPMAALTTDDLARWRESLKMAAGTVQRVASDFKASLNRAARRSKAQLPPSIRETIRDGLANTHPTPPVAREAQVLPDPDTRALISAAWEVDAEGDWGGDLARLVVVLAATGARFSQVMRVTVGDVQPAQKRLMIPVSYKGRGIKTSSYIGVRVGDDVLAVLAKATAGRRRSERLLLRPHWRQIAVTQWVHGERGPWFASSELLRPWKAIIARAGLAQGTIPYALRHSSIVRGLRAGLPVRLVAALHDTSSAMIEAHYSAFIVDAMDELAARAVVPLTTVPATVTPIAAVR